MNKSKMKELDKLYNGNHDLNTKRAIFGYSKNSNPLNKCFRN
ncbi:MAG: hypothetical protein ACRC1M_00295 [Methanobacteriaceae archaeon]